MKKKSFVLTIISLAGIVLFTQFTKRTEAQAVDLKTSARTFVEALKREDFARAVESFGPPLNASLPPEELRKTWKGIITRGGSFAKIASIEEGLIEEYGKQKYDVVIVHCQLARAKMNIRISFNRTGQITSLWFVPSRNNIAVFN